MDIICPVKNGVVTQTYEEHQAYQWAHPEQKYNPGVDFYSDNRNIYACDDGTISRVAFDAGGYGNYIKIAHSWGVSIYAHLASVPAKKAGTVKRGDVIGVMGTTGNSTGIHLHFEMQDQGGFFLNPESYFETCPTAPAENGHEYRTGERFRIACDLGVNFRETPVTGKIIQTLPYGTAGVISGEKMTVCGLPVYPVKIILDGYIAEYDGYGNKLMEAE